MSRRPGLIIAVLAVLVVVVVITVSLRTTPPPTPTGPITPPPGGGEQAVAKPANLQVEGAQVTQRDNDGNIIWQLRVSGQHDYDEATRMLRAEDIHWELVRGGQERLIVEAPTFAASYKDRQIDFEDGVQVYTESKSQVFEMSSLRYEFDTQKLLGQGPVTLRVGKYKVSGKQLVIDNRREEVRITGPGRFSRLAGS